MKILIACDKDIHTNPYVPTLADAMVNLGASVVCSIDDFWNKWNDYDIIHIQWPNLLTFFNRKSSKDVQTQLAIIKNNGVRIVATCHNFVNHYSKEDKSNQAYYLVYQYADCIIHLGEYSCLLMQQKYPHAKHVIIPHHIYDTLHPEIPSRDTAANHLGLDSSKRYILCFGAFRDNEERDLVKLVADRFIKQGYYVLAPTFTKKIKVRKRFHITIFEFISSIIQKIKYRNVIGGTEVVPEEEIAYYYALADIALIQRKHILNSGNVPMAMMMGKVIVGPNVGNVGPFLSQHANPTFDPEDKNSIVESIENAIMLHKQGLGERNKNFAYQELSTVTIAQQHLTLYKELC